MKEICSVCSVASGLRFVTNAMFPFSCWNSSDYGSVRFILGSLQVRVDLLKSCKVLIIFS